MSEIQLHLGDCLEVMKGIPDKSIDMILCDLPYGTTQNKKDKRIDLKALWKEYRRIIKDNGCIALFAQGKFYIDLAMSNYKWFRYDLIWDKKLTSGFLNAKRMPMRRHEQVAIFYKKPPVYNPQFTKGQPLHSKGTKYKTKVQTNNNYGKYGAPANDRAGSTDKYPTSILEVAKPHPSTAQHSTEKPVALCEWLIKTYTNKGMTVLDNCMGSGSVGVAARNTGRNFIGIDKDPESYNKAKERIEVRYSEQQRIEDAYN